MDVHAQVIPPAPPVPVPAPYAGSIFMWTSPKFPMANVLINSKPACTVGAMGYSVHIPGRPRASHEYHVLDALPHPRGHGTDPRRPHHLRQYGHRRLCRPLIPKPPAAADFIKDVTGIDSSSTMSFMTTASASFASFTQWQTWAELPHAAPALPGLPGLDGGGQPQCHRQRRRPGLRGASGGDIVQRYPGGADAATLGFSNVMVGVSIGAPIKGIAVSAAQNAMQ